MVWVGLGWFRAFAFLFVAFAFGIRNPRMRTPFGCSGRGWIGVGFAWFVVGFVWVSEQKHAFVNLLE